jgi:hypothetical protein
LHACAKGILTAEAAVSLLSDCSLGDALTGIGRRNASLVVEAVAHASALSP